MTDDSLIEDIIKVMGADYSVREIPNGKGGMDWECIDRRGKLVFKSKSLISLRRNVLNKLKGKNK